MTMTCIVLIVAQGWCVVTMIEITPPHEVKARKPHYCSWCDKEIHVGEKYTTSTLKIDYVYEWRECSRCKPYVDEMFDDDVWGDYDSGYGIDQQTFWDFMAEKHYDIWCEWQHADEKERQRKRRNAARANR